MWGWGEGENYIKNKVKRAIGCIPLIYRYSMTCVYTIKNQRIIKRRNQQPIINFGSITTLECAQVL